MALKTAIGGVRAVHKVYVGAKAAEEVTVALKVVEGARDLDRAAEARAAVTHLAEEGKASQAGTGGGVRVGAGAGAEITEDVAARRV